MNVELNPLKSDEDEIQIVGSVRRHGFRHLQAGHW